MVTLVKAKLSDIKAMQALVVSEVKDGTILERSEDEVSTNIRSYVLAKEHEEVIGYAALHVHSSRLAEIRSLIVSAEHRGKNIGKEIVQFCLEEARSLEVK